MLFGTRIAIIIARTGDSDEASEALLPDARWLAPESRGVQCPHNDGSPPASEHTTAREVIGGRPYDTMTACGQSKTANMLFAVEADRRYRKDGIRPFACRQSADATAIRAGHAGLFSRRSPGSGTERLRSAEQLASQQER